MKKKRTDYKKLYFTTLHSAGYLRSRVFKLETELAAALRPSLWARIGFFFRSFRWPWVRS